MRGEMAARNAGNTRFGLLRQIPAMLGATQGDPKTAGFVLIRLLIGRLHQCTRHVIRLFQAQPHSSTTGWSESGGPSHSLSS